MPVPGSDCGGADRVATSYDAGEHGTGVVDQAIGETGAELHGVLAIDGTGIYHGAGGARHEDTVAKRTLNNRARRVADPTAFVEEHRRIR